MDAAPPSSPTIRLDPMRRAAAALVVFASLAIPAVARAEDGDAGKTNPIHYTTEPLRLALLRDRFSFGSRMPGCESSEAVRDNWLTRELSPHLHFLAIMRSGCGLETGGGGGLAYTIEVRPNIYVVASIGAWLSPPVDGAELGKVRVEPVARLDLVFPMKDGRSLNLGIFATRRALGLGFGGVY